MASDMCDYCQCMIADCLCCECKTLTVYRDEVPYDIEVLCKACSEFESQRSADFLGLLSAVLFIYIATNGLVA